MKPRVQETADLLLMVGAIWLGARGHDPSEVAARVQRVIERMQLLRAKIVDYGEAHARAAVGCVAPKVCGCLVCSQTPEKTA
jgi:hypothetical protein